MRSRFADQLGWPEFHVISHSMGGKAAQKVAMDAGARVQSGRRRHPGAGFGFAIRRSVFRFFAAACEQDETALTLMGDSLGNRVSRTWLELMLRRRARYGKAGSIQELYALLHQG